MKKSHLTVPLILFFLAAPLASLSQVLSFQQYTTKDGLPSNQINAIYQDSRGFLWIGTNNGLSIYDGTSFTNYSSIDGLSNNWISCLTESRKSPGTMWFGTVAGGVNKWVDGRFVKISLGKSMNANNVDSIIEDQRGILWCGAVDGVYLIENDHVIPLVTGLKNYTDILFAETKHGLIWVSINATIAIYSLDQKKRRSIELPLRQGGYISCMTADLEGNIWVGTSDSTIFQFSDTLMVQQRKLIYGMAYQIIEDGQGYLWVRTHDELVKIPKSGFAKGEGEYYAIDDQSRADWAGGMLMDRENNLWVGTWVRGLLKLADLSLYKIPLSPADHGHTAIADSKAHVWIGSQTGLHELFRDEKGTWQKYQHRLEHTAKSEIAVWLHDSFNRLWVWEQSDGNTMLNGYAILPHAGKASTLTLVKRLVQGVHFPKGLSRSFYVDRNNRAWGSFNNIGVVVIDLESLQTLRIYKKEDAAPGGGIYAIYEDREGNIWLGDFDDGLSILYASRALPDSFRKFTTADGLPDNRIRSIHQDREGRIWVGTRHGGLALYQDGKFKTISMQDGLRSNAIWWIADDDRHRLWLLTDMGFESIDLQTLNLLPPKTELLGERVFTNGLLYDKFLWFITREWLNIYEFPRSTPNLTPPPVHIKRLQVNGNPVSGFDGIELSHDQNNCLIEFAGISLKDEKAVRYQYRLKGIDSDWSPPTEYHEVTYATLSPGEYTFEVIAINGDGVKSIQPAVLRFTIHPPFWQRWWFIAIAGAAGAGILFMIYRYRVERLLAMERLRTRIASDLHDDVGATLTKIVVHSEVIQTTNNPNKIIASSREIGALSREIISIFSDIIWSIDARHDTFGDLMDRMRSFALDILTTKEMQVRFEAGGMETEKKIAPPVRQNLYLIFKEAVNNIARHAGATAVNIQLTPSLEGLTMIIHDNGIGLPEQIKASGHGLKNMRERAKQIGGRLELENQNGLKITVTAKSL